MSSYGNETLGLMSDSLNLVPSTESSNTLELHPSIILSFFQQPEERPHSCTICSARYKTRTHLKRHMYVHLKARPFVCSYPDCQKGFNRKEHLAKHEDAVHKLSKFKCHYCAKEISRKDHLNRHIKNMHTFPTAPPPVDVPKRKKIKDANSNATNNICISLHPSTSTTHFILNSSSADDEIGTLDQNYTITSTSNVSNSSNFLTNVNNNTNGHGVLELFSCPECSSSFLSEKDLEFHTKTHKAQPYKCTQCHRAYTRREKLSEHVRCFHQGQKFTCEYCGKDLSRKDHVLRHVRSVHPEVLASRFVEMSENSDNIIANYKSIDNNSLLLRGSNGLNLNMCPDSPSGSVENSSVPSMGDMGALLKSVCHLCLRVFGTSYHLGRHIQSVHNHNNRPFSCNFCSKQFKRKDHLAIHKKSHCNQMKEPFINGTQISTSDKFSNLQVINSLQIELTTSDGENQTLSNILENEKVGQETEKVNAFAFKSIKKKNRGSKGSVSENFTIFTNDEIVEKQNDEYLNENLNLTI